MIENFTPSDARRHIFEHYKTIQSTIPSKLALNYSKWFNLDEQETLTYYKKSVDADPSIFSTIYRRNWWPTGAYRILNRTWQYPRVTAMEKTINDGLYDMIESQLEWCRQQPNFSVAIITRNKNKRLFNKMQADLKQRGIDFFIGKKIWVCEGAEDDCYQHVLYYGNKDTIDQWSLPCR